MSIILKALKSSDQENQKKDVAPVINDEGFFSAKSTIVKKKYPVNKRTWILALTLVLVSALGLTLRLLKRSGETRTVPTKIEIIVPQVGQDQGQQTVQQPVALTGSAEEAFQNGRYDDSLKLYKEELKKDPNDANLHNNIGMVFIKKELFSSAASEFQKALELDGDCAECFNNFGYLKALLGETREAQKYLEKAVRISNSYPDPYFNLAVLLEKDGDIGNAVKYYQQFVTLHPDKNSQIVSDVNKKINLLKGK